LGVIARKTLVQWSVTRSPYWSNFPLVQSSVGQNCRVPCSCALIDCMIDFGVSFYWLSLCRVAVTLLSSCVTLPVMSCLSILPASRQCGLGPKRWLRRCVLSQRSPGPYWSGSNTVDWPPSLPSLSPFLRHTLSSSSSSGISTDTA